MGETSYDASPTLEFFKDENVKDVHRYNGFRVGRGYYKVRKKKWKQKIWKRDFDSSVRPDLRVSTSSPKRLLGVNTSE